MNKLSLILVITIFSLVFNNSLQQSPESNRDVQIEELKKALTYLKDSFINKGNQNNKDENVSFPQVALPSRRDEDNYYIYDDVNFNDFKIKHEEIKEYYPSDLKKLIDDKEEISKNKEKHKHHKEKLQFLQNLEEETENLIKDEVKNNLGKIAENIVNKINEKEPEFLGKLNKKWEKKAHKFEEKIENLLDKIKSGFGGK